MKFVPVNRRIVIQRREKDGEEKEESLIELPEEELENDDDLWVVVKPSFDCFAARWYPGMIVYVSEHAVEINYVNDDIVYTVPEAAIKGYIEK